jgi:hypothetical protein
VVVVEAVAKAQEGAGEQHPAERAAHRPHRRTGSSRSG